MHDNNLVVLDGDGVLWNYDLAFQKTAEKVLQRQVRLESNVYLLNERYGLTRDEVSQVKHELSKDFYNIPELDHAHELVQGIQSRGYDIVLLTAVSESEAKQRAQRVKDLDWNFVDVIAVPHEHASVQKGRHIDRLRPYAFMDDNLKYLSHANHCEHLVLLQLGYEDLGKVPSHVTVVYDPLDFLSVLDQGFHHSSYNDNHAMIM